MSTRPPLLLLFLLSVMPLAPAQATLVVALPLERLAQVSDRIVRGTVIDVIPYAAEGRIERRVILRQSLDYTHGVSEPQLLEIRALGGVLGDIATVVPGAESWETGDEVVAFLQRDAAGHWRTTALAQSLFVVDREAAEALVRRSLDGVQVTVDLPALPSALPLRELEHVLLNALHPDAQ